MFKDLFPKLCRQETLKIAVNYVFDDQRMISLSDIPELIDDFVGGDVV